MFEDFHAVSTKVAKIQQEGSCRQRQDVQKVAWRREANYVSEFEIPHLEGFSEFGSDNIGHSERIYSQNLGHPSSRSKEPTLRDLL